MLVTKIELIKFRKKASKNKRIKDRTYNGFKRTLLPGEEGRVSIVPDNWPIGLETVNSIVVMVKTLLYI